MIEPHKCPKCGEAMLCYYRRLPYKDAYEWSWLCPDCQHIERIPRGIVDSFLKKS